MEVIEHGDALVIAFLGLILQGYQKIWIMVYNINTLSV